MCTPLFLTPQQKYHILYKLLKPDGHELCEAQPSQTSLLPQDDFDSAMLTRGLCNTYCDLVAHNMLDMVFKILTFLCGI